MHKIVRSTKIENSRRTSMKQPLSHYDGTIVRTHWIRKCLYIFQEFLCIIPGLLYFLAIPSMSMLMFLYSIGNLHIVSWGTRETKQVSTEPKSKETKHKPEKEERGYFCTLGNFFGYGWMAAVKRWICVVFVIQNKVLVYLLY